MMFSVVLLQCPVWFDYSFISLCCNIVQTPSHLMQFSIFLNKVLICLKTIISGSKCYFGEYIESLLKPQGTLCVWLKNTAVEMSVICASERQDRVILFCHRPQLTFLVSDNRYWLLGFKWWCLLFAMCSFLGWCQLVVLHVLETIYVVSLR